MSAGLCRLLDPDPFLRERRQLRRLPAQFWPIRGTARGRLWRRRIAPRVALDNMSILVILYWACVGKMGCFSYAHLTKVWYTRATVGLHLYSSDAMATILKQEEN